MTSFSENHGSGQTRTYNRGKSVVFRKTSEAFGGLSNMASGFLLGVNGIRVLTSEALYQACRFPHLQKVQRLIIEQVSPMTAKMKSKTYRRESRPDWDQVRVKIMRWCLRVKLAQNWNKFGELLSGTGDRPIVEQSRKDEFWGVKAVDDQTLIGMNVLGRLLMELREELRSGRHERLLRVDPLQIPDFLLDGRSIEPIVAKGASVATSVRREVASTKPSVPKPGDADQPSLFEQPSLPAHPEPPGQGLVSILKPYPAYKDSGVPWLGEVPEHWDIQRLKSRTENVIEQTVHHQPGEIYVALEHVEGWTGQLRNAGSDAAFDSQVKRFRAGDVLFGKLRPYLAKVARPTRDGVCVGEFFVLRTRGDGSSAAYLEHLLRSKPIIDVINSSTFGAKMPRADWQFVGSVALSFPPLPEQSAIVRFLDHANRRIRRYIRAKQKLIALLNEQKQAIIHCAVTRGLDSNVRLKPSGAEWLRDVPDHWREVLLGRSLKRIEQGWSPVAAEGALMPDQWAVLTLSSVKRGLFDAAAIKPVPSAAKVPGGIEITDGDLLLTRSNTRELVGDVCVAKGARPKTLICDLIYRLIVDETVFDRRFLMYQLLSPLGRRQIERDARGSSGTMPKIAQRHIRSWKVVAPSLEEQRLIVRAIDGTLSEINEATQRAKSEISLLREYRTRLIADVVTGKLDVREVAAHLPDEADEPEALQDGDTLTEGDNDTDEADLDALPAEVEA